jgi:putative transposase
VRAALSGVSERRTCRLLAVGRAGLHRLARTRQRRLATDPSWVEPLRRLIQQHPTFGYRHLWALLRGQEGIIVNRKAVYRVLKQKQWLVHQRSCTPRPRVRGWVSRASRSNERWAMDVTHIPCGQDGWAHLAAVIDCHDREVIGYEFALRSRAKEAERAVEAACLHRFGTLRPTGAPVLRSDNGLIFQSRRFRQACRDYRLQQEFITPYTPEQNGVIERFFRSLKEECVWQHTFRTFEEARQMIRDWLQWYNYGRPHSALGYRSPIQYRAQQSTQVA